MTSQLKVLRYESGLRERWDEMVANAKNSVFFFNRNFMEYHADRFVDHSLLFAEGEKIVAALPASEHGNGIVSHGGLTFGGLLTDFKRSTEDVLGIFEALTSYYASIGKTEIIYKAIPSIYHKYPAEEDLYALFRRGAELVRRDAGAALRPRDRIKYAGRRIKSVKAAGKHRVRVAESDDFTSFWNILAGVLDDRHGKTPTHTEQELRLLKQRFAKNIRLFAAFLDDGMVSGALVFENEKVAHTQYLANSPEGRGVYALDFLIDQLITTTYVEKDWFSFGISTEDEGRYLNENLMIWKEAFGARCVVNDVFRIGL